MKRHTLALVAGSALLILAPMHWRAWRGADTEPPPLELVLAIAAQLLCGALLILYGRRRRG